MSNKHGFTLIEMLLCLSLISCLSLFTFQYFTKRSNPSSDLLFYLEQAQSYSISHKTIVYIQFENHIMRIYTSDMELSTLRLDDERFYPNKTFYFNEEGHINQAGTVYIEGRYKTKTLVFNLGMGRYYVQE